MKLPLSTTFVTFMVAMSTSLADKAWGRESAVYRVTGVLTVLGGWFFTAFMAFTTCFLFSIFIYYFKLVAILILVAAAVYFFIKTNRLHKDREDALKRKEVDLAFVDDHLNDDEKIASYIGKYVDNVSNIVERCYDGLLKNSRKKLKVTKKELEHIEADRDRIIGDIFVSISNRDEDIDEAPIYARKIGAMQIIFSNLRSLVLNNFKHIENNHRVPTEEQAEEMRKIGDEFVQLMSKISKSLSNHNYSEFDTIVKDMDKFQDEVYSVNKKQMKRIKKKKSGSRQSLLFVSDLSQIERIAEQSLELLKLHE